jgi:histidine triad (HIT) family protein
MTTIFTKIINREISADIVYEDDIVLAFLDINPVNKGHVLVVPKKEFENIFDADIAVLGHMMVVAQKISHALVETVGARGVNLHMNNGEDAGQEVPHAHLHIIPRFQKGEAFVAAKHETYAAGESAVLAEKIKTAIA